MPAKITSRANPIVKELRAVRDGRVGGLVFLEGPNLLEEVLRGGLEIELLVWTPALAGDPLVARAAQRAARAFEASESVFGAVSDVKSPQGVLAAARRPAWGWTEVLAGRPAPVVVLDGVQDPGNLAAILRTAEAAGAAGLVSSGESARVFSPKALRAAAGASLRLPSLEGARAQEAAEKLKKAGYVLIAASMLRPGRASVAYLEADWSRPAALVLGGEGQGLSPAWDSLCSERVHIPMRGAAESLNVAAAAAVLLFEAVRRRPA